VESPTTTLPLKRQNQKKTVLPIHNVKNKKIGSDHGWRAVNGKKVNVATHMQGMIVLFSNILLASRGGESEQVRIFFINYNMFR
jgi:hypothetical protein